MVPIVAPIFSFSKIVSIILCKGDRNNNLLYNNKKTCKVLKLNAKRVE